MKFSKVTRKGTTLRQTTTYHSQPLESIRHAGNYFVPISIRPIFIFLLQKLCQITWLLTGWKIISTSGGPLRPEAVAFAKSATWLVRHCQRVTNKCIGLYVWNALPSTVNFASLNVLGTALKRLIGDLTTGLAFWHCAHTMRSRVYKTVRCPSVSLSVRFTPSRWTCRTSSFYTAAWLLARFQLNVLVRALLVHPAH